MKAFHTIAIPHRDILEGRLTMETFAADLWEAYHGRGVEEYSNASTFFHKTYLTQGLSNLIGIIQRRLEGKGGDPVIQIQTPFGGGKTHSLIALMHKSKQWGFRCVVIVGTNLSAERTLWELMEEQLEGEVKIMTSRTSPGKEKIKNLLEKHKPVLILIDELVEYAVKAGGIKVGESTLAGQTLAFMQELSETVASMNNVALVITLPSSSLEQYDKNAEMMLAQLQKVLGRVEKIYTPVNEQEIAKVIRKRLFSSIDQEEVGEVVNEFIDYAEKEKILPIGMETSEYRNRFLDSYPFLPDVIDVLYHRWGSFSTFQRTRGVLRLLSLVVHNLKEKPIPYISLADFDLSNQEIRQELIKHIGDTFNSVIAQDITDADSGSRKVDLSLGDAYRGLKIATRAATTMFMYSFSGGSEKGATMVEIKRNATVFGNPATVVSEAIEQLKSKLFYTQIQNDKYLFSSTPNLNRILLNKIENVAENEIINVERKLIESLTTKDHFDTYIWEEKTENIPDTQKLKLIILRQEKEELIKEIIGNKGSNPRVNCNTLIFLCPVQYELSGLVETIRRYLAYKSLIRDKNLQITNEQKKELEEKLKQEEKAAADMVLRAYQCVIYPSGGANISYEKECMGPPRSAEKKNLNERVYDFLKGRKILEEISPIVILNKFLKGKERINTKSLLNAFYTTPGEVMISSPKVLQDGILKGVQQKLFQIGKLIDNGPEAKNVKLEGSEVTFDDEEIIQPFVPTVKETEVSKAYGGEDIQIKEQTQTRRLRYSFEIPEGKLSDIMKMISGLAKSVLKVKINIEGNFNENERGIIIETLNQLKIEFQENETNETIF